MNLVARTSSALDSDGHAQMSVQSSEVADVGVDLATFAGFPPQVQSDTQ